MSTVEPTTSSPPAPSSDMDESFCASVVLGKVFEAMLKKPDDDSDDSRSAGVGNEINRAIAEPMARAVTGFGQ